MQKIIKLIFLLVIFLPVSSMACEVCQARQPKALKGITHGTGPEAAFDMVIIWGAVAIVGITLFLSIQYLVRPKESAPDHIKNIILYGR